MFDFHSDYTSIRFSQELITLRAEGNETERNSEKERDRDREKAKKENDHWR